MLIRTLEGLIMSYRMFDYLVPNVNFFGPMPFRLWANAANYWAGCNPEKFADIAGNSRRKAGLVVMLALELAGVDVVLLHLTPQRSAANVQQMRHFLHPSAGDAGGMDNRLFLDSRKRQTGG